MKSAAVVLMLATVSIPVHAVDFLGVELCQGSTETGVTMPPGSSLVLESVEIGDSGGLVMLLSARSGRVMNHVDDLMTGMTGQRGEGDSDSLEWSGGRLTGVAQRVAKKYAALAVTSTDDCVGTAPAPVTTEAADGAAPVDETTRSTPEPASVEPVEAVAVSAVAATASSVPDPEPEPVVTTELEFQVIGAISHEAADQTWVDVMGVVANHTSTGYRLATFDLSLFAEDGSLICVDTISVSVLKSGQERAFRDAIRCPGYDPEGVAETRLQFSGGF